MIDRFDVTHIILTGDAGGLDEKLGIGDIVIGNEIAYHDVAKEILTEYHPRMKDIYFRADAKMVRSALIVSETLKLSSKCHIGRIITGELFITEKERHALIQNFQPLCVDMESASVAHVCYVNGIPFIVIRSISDFADDGGADSFVNNMEAASLNALSITENLIVKMNEWDSDC